MADQPQYYFNLKTHQVEEGKISGADDRMGPYPTREAAMAALAGAEARNEQWEEEDKAWNRE